MPVTSNNNLGNNVAAGHDDSTVDEETHSQTEELRSRRR